MDISIVTKKEIVLTLLFSIGICILVFVKSISYQDTRIVFCDVGQGDGAYIRTDDNIDIVIDAGPDNKMLSCLGKYMPFFDKTIELAFLSHPQKDHYGGFLSISERYRIKTFIATPIHNDTIGYNKLIGILKDKKVTIENFFAGQTIRANQTTIFSLWPPADLFINDAFCKEKLCQGLEFYSSLGTYTTSLDLNLFSEILIVKIKDFSLLFTGDADFNNHYFSSLQAISPVTILKVPHHGSKSGLSYNLLMLADPQLSVISVGKNNSYGHPSKNVLNMFEALKKKYIRTDEHGDIIIQVSDTGWKIID